MSSKNYAWYMYPEPEGKSYSKSDLANPDVVEEVFDYCQILLAAIFEEGWQFLLSNYSLEELAEIDRKSGWFQPCTDHEFRESIEHMALISGYNPETDKFGIYDEKSGNFKSKS